MSIYSLGASALGGAALAGFITWRVATSFYATDLGNCHTALVTSQANVVGLQSAVDDRNAQIASEHKAYLVAKAKADALQHAANERAGVANTKAQKLLVYKPGDDYALASLDVVMESLK